MIQAATAEAVKVEPTQIDILCKVRELALKILFKAWKAWFNKVEDCVSATAKW